MNSGIFEIHNILKSMGVVASNINIGGSKPDQGLSFLSNEPVA